MNNKPNNKYNQPSNQPNKPKDASSCGTGSCGIKKSDSCCPEMKKERCDCCSKNCHCNDCKACK